MYLCKNVKDKETWQLSGRGRPQVVGLGHPKVSMSSEWEVAVWKCAGVGEGLQK